MTFTEAAAQVLRLVGKPLHYKEITDVAIEKNLLSHVGKSPEVTMGARLAALVKKDEKDNPLVRVKPGVFALRDWDKKTIDQGLADRTPALQRIAELEKAAAKEAAAKEFAAKEAAAREARARAEAIAAGETPEPVEVEVVETGAEPEPSTAATSEEDDDDEVLIGPAAEVVRAPAVAAVFAEDEEEDEPILDADRERAELRASASEMFEAEDDDDEPIFGATEAEDDTDAGAKRRRRRRRRGRPGDEKVEAFGLDGLPSYTVGDAPAGEEVVVAAESEVDDAGRRRDRGRDERRGERDRGERDRGERDRGERDRGERDRGERDRGERGRRDPGGPLEELSGVALADAVAVALGALDRSGVTLSRLCDTFKQRGRSSLDPAALGALIFGSLRSDNLRRELAGERPRFRLGAKIVLVEATLDGEIVRLERELSTLVERYREATRRQLQRKIQDVPARAVGELVQLVLDRLGVSGLAPVRRPGAPGSELHLMGKLTSGAVEQQLAVVIRRDGREVGRERVTELRGALHHYGSAQAGMLITTGQVLSGAREEAAAVHAAPVTLIDGARLARLCEEQGIGVVRSTLALSQLDVDLFDALGGGSRGS